MNLDRLFRAIGRIHSLAQTRAGLAINQTLNWRNWLIGAYIVEFEQGGEDRAEYGEKVLKTLADRLKATGHKGLSSRNLKNFRQVALAYANLEIRQTASAVLGISEHPEKPAWTGLFEDETRQTASAQSREAEKSHAPSSRDALPALVYFPTLQSKIPDLPWRNSAWTARLFSSLSFSHLLELSRVDEPIKRGFYELECIKSGWSVRELKRQRDSMLFERVGLSRDREAVMALAEEGRLVDSPETILRDPYVLEFTGLGNRLPLAVIRRLFRFGEAAVKLYELGRLSSGRAAELADMPRVEFLMALERYRVFPFASELDDLESGNA